MEKCAKSEKSQPWEDTALAKLLLKDKTNA